MIKLRNIINDGTEIRCDFLVEDCAEYGQITIDLSTKEMKYSIPANYEWCKHHISKAYDFLLNTSDNLPATRNIVWY